MSRNRGLKYTGNIFLLLGIHFLNVSSYLIAYSSLSQSLNREQSHLPYETHVAEVGSFWVSWGECRQAICLTHSADLKFVKGSSLV